VWCFALGQFGPATTRYIFLSRFVLGLTFTRLGLRLCLGLRLRELFPSEET
jgi:hypothetical protein